jgi:activator of 2-hydroxyglutaryl-CoA dehydratase
VDRILLDSGTAYTKLVRLEDGGYQVLPSRSLKGLVERFQVVAATGHNAARFSGRILNELLALAYGGLELVKEPDFVLVDCGARDIKLVRVQDRRVQEMNWNTECGAFCGQTVELLLGHFGLSAQAIPPATKPLAVTCGVLGMTQLFDLVANGVAPAEALARFVRGIAENVHKFAGRPERLYLSGGLCDNRLFLDSLPCHVVPLGRFVLLEGLRAELARTNPELCGVMT